MEITLTIAIPTYNRIEKLKDCLNRVLKDCISKPIEILISDNASEDGTEEYMINFCENNSGVKYYRNNENLGPDRNFLNCYEKAKGKYIWLLSDDDMILPGAIDSILEALNHSPVFLHLNSSGIITDDPFKITEPRFKEEGLLIYESKDELFKKMGIYITFLSGLVLRTDLVKKIENKEQYIGTYFIQSHIALKTMEQDGQYMILTKNCMAASANTTVSYDVYFVWGKQYYELLINTGKNIGISLKCINDIHKKDLKTTILGFVKLFRRSCVQSKEWNASYILDVTKKYPLLYLRYFIETCIPVSILDINIKIIKLFKMFIK